ncbi:hypothetical protein Q3O60_07560 [Alkalimonas collagenimarina]|uniref:Uncharacterized protein n=1 Tax=Alkalimonas collagenimarina TaxID=400390 RepID=A0ABT9GYD9_9GAMM|nr:hypothetical protein [Alkalimonas collagenimarina]MDP4536038.1 hypothetical protein [Alkalimonas collagenimarina]
MSVVPVFIVVCGGQRTAGIDHSCPPGVGYALNSYGQNISKRQHEYVFIG